MERKMKYLLIPFLLYAGAAQADGFLSVKPSFIGVNFGNNPLLSAKAGVQFGQNNQDSAVQKSAVNFYGVQQVSIGKAGSNQSNETGVYQQGVSSYAGVGQAIESLPAFPSSTP